MTEKPKCITVVTLNGRQHCRIDELERHMTRNGSTPINYHGTDDCEYHANISNNQMRWLRTMTLPFVTRRILNAPGTRGNLRPASSIDSVSFEKRPTRH